MGGLVKWYIRGVVNQILAFIPNLLVAVLILAAFAWLANIARNFVGGAVESAGMPNGGALGTIAYVTGRPPDHWTTRPTGKSVSRAAVARISRVCS